jgi:hypothetical protein
LRVQPGRKPQRHQSPRTPGAGAGYIEGENAGERQARVTGVPRNNLLWRGEYGVGVVRCRVCLFQANAGDQAEGEFPRVVGGKSSPGVASLQPTQPGGNRSAGRTTGRIWGTTGRRVSAALPGRHAGRAEKTAARCRDAPMPSKPQETQVGATARGGVPSGKPTWTVRHLGGTMGGRNSSSMELAAAPVRSRESVWLATYETPRPHKPGTEGRLCLGSHTALPNTASVSEDRAPVAGANGRGACREH